MASRSTRTGLKFPVGRVMRHARSYDCDLDNEAAVFLTAVLEEITRAVVSDAAEHAQAANKARIGVVAARTACEKIVQPIVAMEL